MTRHHGGMPHEKKVKTLLGVCHNEINGVNLVTKHEIALVKFDPGGPIAAPFEHRFQIV